MKTTITLLFCLFLGSANSQNSIWVKQGKSANNERGNDLAQDNSGNIYITGDYFNTITFETTTINNTSFKYCAKYDSNGNLIWVKDGLGGNGISYDGNSNLYLFNNSNSSLQKIDLDGNIIWNNTLFTSSTFGSLGIHDVYVTGTDVYVTGFYSGNANFGSTTLLNTNETDGNWDIFIAKYNTSGVLQWAKTAGGTGLDKGYSIFATASGEIFTTGFFRNTSTFGTNTITSNGNADIYIAKYDSNGNNLWVNKTGGTGFDLAAKIISDNTGNLLLTGRFNNSVSFGSENFTAVGTDGFISKINTNGDYLWTKPISGQGNDEEADIFHDGTNIHFIATTSGNVTISSNTITQKGGLDICIGSMDNNGSLFWGKTYASVSNDEASGISYYSGSTYFTGSFNNTATFDSLTLTGLGNWDVVTGKIENNLSIKNNDVSNFSIYPNPTKNSIKIKGLGNDFEPTTFVITNMLGSIIATYKWEQLNNSEEYNINIDSQPNGMYFISINSKEGRQETHKIIKN